MIKLTAKHESFPIAGTFTISRGSKTTVEVVVVELSQDGVIGRGECVPYARYGESIASVMAQIHDMEIALGEGMDRARLNATMPPGAARNAIDCAFWDLEAKRSGIPVWKAAGFSQAPEALITAYTLSLDTPEVMAKAAKKNSARPLFKLKLTGEGDLERVAAVREAAPDTRLIVDANEGWSPEMVEPFSEKLGALGVEMIEQPLPAAKDAVLADLAHPVPLCADESAHARKGLQSLIGKYDVINIKLEKTGGLTEALLLRAEAEAAGMDIMIGCMLATSLGMAPAFLAAQGVKFVDLDGPLLLAIDRKPGFEFDGSLMHPPKPELWG
ncbi:MAG: dipeptide epimerase [Alphaproteobacteria bacterium]|nr:dipeptide epimerase [Alphaproteobacteria bacterium]